MKRNEGGFTMIELLVTMVIFVLTIAAATAIFVPLLTEFKQQGKITESQMQGIVGLEMLRKDIEHAGYGLPWRIEAGVAYNEAGAAVSGTYGGAGVFTQTNDAPSNPPRGILSGDGVGLGGSDYLVIKATNVAINDASQKNTHVIRTGGVPVVKLWGTRPDPEDLNDGDRVVVIIPSRGTDNQKILVSSGASFYTQFSLGSFPELFSPSTENDEYLIYGVDPNTNLRMPFNRADYYLRTPAANFPPRCATGTRILYKNVVTQAGGLLMTANEIPLLDCVADMQVIYGLDNDDDGDFEPGGAGSTDGYSSDLIGSGLTAQQIRNRVKEVRVYILAHEGQRDTNYTYPNATVTVGEFGLGSTFNFAANGIANWQNYRWKVYTLVVKPKNLRG